MSVETRWTRQHVRGATVGGRDPANQLIYVDMIDIYICKYPIIYKVLYIPGGAGFLPSTVSYLIFNMYLYNYLLHLLHHTFR